MVGALVAALVLGIFGRLAGMSKPWLGTHQGVLGDLLFWALPATVVTACLFSFASYWAYPVIFAAWWLGRIIFAWGQLDYAGKYLNDDISEYNAMRGAFVTLFVALILPYPIILIGFGMMMPVAYWFASWHCRTINSSFLNQGPEIGDVIFYSLVGLGLGLTAWLGA